MTTIQIDLEGVAREAAEHWTRAAAQRLADIVSPPPRSTERGDWFVSYTGRRMWILDPSPDEIHPIDICHALSQICRFGGHTQGFWSVASHSVLCSRIVPPRHALEALLHDAPEAYLGDVISPLKRWLKPAYALLEARWWDAIAKRFGLAAELHPTIKQADLTALATERRDLVRVLDLETYPWAEDEAGMEPSPVHHAWSCMPERSFIHMVDRWRELAPEHWDGVLSVTPEPGVCYCPAPMVRIEHATGTGEVDRHFCCSCGRERARNFGIVVNPKPPRKQ